MSGIIKYAFRSLSRTPGVSAVVIATLAIGIALVTGMITLLNGYAWAALPYPEADRIIAVGVQDHYGAMGHLPAELVQDVRGLGSIFAEVAAYQARDKSLRIGDASVLASTIATDNNLFSLLRVTPATGRLFTAEDGDAVAVLSYNGWRRHFAEDPQVLGRTVYTEGVARTVIGVLPKEFGFEGADVFVPLRLGQSDWAAVIGRLGNGVSASTARTRIEAFRLPPDPTDDTPGKVTINEDMTQRDPLSHAGSMLLMFIAATAFVLLIACANVISILLARGVARRPQYAIRAALGAGRKRLFLENIAESVVLAIIATTVGVFLASWAVSIFVATLGQSFPSWLRFPIDAHVVAASGIIALFVILFIGWLPAWEAGRSGPISLLNSLTVTRGIKESRIGRWVVAAEIALSAALFIGTVLLLRSFTAASNLRVGYDDENVAVARVRLDETRFHNAADIDAYISRAERSLDMAASRRHALIGEFGGYRTVIGDTMPSWGDWGQVIVESQDRHVNYINVVNDDYFKLLGLNILAGRAFNAADARGTLPVAIVSTALAEELWPKQQAVGQTFQLGRTNPVTVTVAGVVQSKEAIRSNRAGITLTSRPEIYLPAQQVVTRNMEFLLKGEQGSDVGREITNAINRADPSVAISGNAELMRDQNMSMARDLKMFAWLFGSIAGVALVLSIIGLFGIIAYSAQQRTREIGVRIALGAGPQRIAFDIMQEALKIIGVGLLLGFGMSMLMGVGLRGFMYGITATDPLTYIIVTVTFATVAILAAWLPSRRAMRIDPINALRPD